MKKVSGVFFSSLAIMIVLVLFGMTMPSVLEQVTGNMQAFITTKFGWYYLLVVTFFVGVCFYFLFSPVGRIKLGKQDEKPEFSRPTWVAMIFSAGIGIGLIFYGTAEPISHFAISSPTGVTGTDQAVKDAMLYTFFHWGIHAWAIYGIVGLSVAYFTFRKGEVGLISKTLRPLLGDRVDGWLGKVIDVVAVVSTIIGVATTLGFGTAQINGGLSYLFDIPNSFGMQVLIVFILTVLFLLSASTGLRKGIKILSNFNMGLTAVLFICVLVFGPTMFIMNLFTDTLGSYAQNFIKMSFRLAPMNEAGREWINGWTIFYWSWWIAWSPFVGIFIARVSKGRTIREFIVYVLLVPSVIGFIWFSTFGSAAITAENSGAMAISELPIEASLFGLLEQYPLTFALSMLTIAIIITFFVTSADSGTYVLGMMTSNGSLIPSVRVKMIWGVFLSVTALVLLYSGGLQALQNTMIIVAFPFSAVIALMTLSLIKAVNAEARELGIGQVKLKEKKTETKQAL
ncbi:choline transporter [Planococcus maritimus]|uniref:BCCT family transporter n=2 Tax=Bacillales TaxID=1385 RepID=UPI00080EEBDE|nr:BCCT family transporter [Planococcus maritimus]ANU16379.1 choline transporter [Planococcus maritimus]